MNVWIEINEVRVEFLLFASGLTVTLDFSLIYYPFPLIYDTVSVYCFNLTLPTLHSIPHHLIRDPAAST